MRRSTQLLRALRSTHVLATVGVSEPLSTCRHACATLPGLSGLAERFDSHFASAASASAQLSSAQPWLTWSPAAAVLLRESGLQQRSFASRPKKPLRNKRAQAALARQRPPRASPVTYDVDPAPADAADGHGLEVVPSESVPSAVEVRNAWHMTAGFSCRQHTC
jgi:hypothetical protein